MRPTVINAWRLTLGTVAAALLAAIGAGLGGWIGLSLVMGNGDGGADIGAPIVYPAAAIGGGLLGAVVTLAAVGVACVRRIAAWSRPDSDL